MIRKILNRIWNGPERQEFFYSEVLGKMKLNRNIVCWKSKIKFDDKEVRFIAGGISVPDPKIIQILESIAGSFEVFQENIVDFLKQESQKSDPFGEEILKLVIREIMYSRPDMPTNGMVFFNGPVKNRVWHCDLIKGKPRYLAFDT
jgi:spore cortex formation protein SpoVR/YcgB (stage V sporulation)